MFTYEYSWLDGSHLFSKSFKINCIFITILTIYIVRGARKCFLKTLVRYVHHWLLCLLQMLSARSVTEMRLYTYLHLTIIRCVVSHCVTSWRSAFIALYSWRLVKYRWKRWRRQKCYQGRYVDWRQSFANDLSVFFFSIKRFFAQMIITSTYTVESKFLACQNYCSSNCTLESLKKSSVHVSSSLTKRPSLFITRNDKCFLDKSRPWSRMREQSGPEKHQRGKIGSQKTA